MMVGYARKAAPEGQPAAKASKGARSARAGAEGGAAPFLIIGFNFPEGVWSTWSYGQPCGSLRDHTV